MKWSDYTRVKQSKSMIGADNPNYGNKWSQEQKDEASKKKKRYFVRRKGWERKG